MEPTPTSPPDKGATVTPTGRPRLSELPDPYAILDARDHRALYDAARKLWPETTLLAWHRDPTAAFGGRSAACLTAFGSDGVALGGLPLNGPADPGVASTRDFEVALAAVRYLDAAVVAKTRELRVDERRHAMQKARAAVEEALAASASASEDFAVACGSHGIKAERTRRMAEDLDAPHVRELDGIADRLGPIVAERGTRWQSRGRVATGRFAQAAAPGSAIMPGSRRVTGTVVLDCGPEGPDAFRAIRDVVEKVATGGNFAVKNGADGRREAESFKVERVVLRVGGRTIPLRDCRYTSDRGAEGRTLGLSFSVDAEGAAALDEVLSPRPDRG